MSKTRKNTPKVTNKQRRMDDAGKAAWKTSVGFAKLDKDTQTAIDAKLAQPLTVRKAGGKAVAAYDADWAKGLTLMQLLSAQTVIIAALKGRDAEKADAKAKIAAQIAALQSQKTVLDA